MISRLHYISQSQQGSTHLEAIESVLKAGGQWIQLRVKQQSAAEVLELARAARTLCDAYGAKLIVNDYPLVALKAGADGVHLGLADMSVAEARRILGQHKIIGSTANTVDHVLRAVKEGADYIGLGPYRFTNTKQNLSPIIGLQGYINLMKQLREAGITIPVIAIGGIEPADVPLLLQAGLHGVAISGALSIPEHSAPILHKIQALIHSSVHLLKNLTC